MWRGDTHEGLVGLSLRLSLWFDSSEASMKWSKEVGGGDLRRGWWG